MCWNLEVSIASACVGWFTCIYLLWRRRERDLYYARYLVTFTFTQLVDAFLWSLNRQSEPELQACTSFQFQFGASPTGEIESRNFFVSKYIIPLIVFSQHATQLSYPSEAFRGHRGKVIAGHAVPCIIMSFCFGCTKLVPASFPFGGKTLFWGGDFSAWPFSVIQFGAMLHSGLVATGFPLFCGMRGAVLYAHLLPLASVVSFLLLTEGRMDFGSKWCTYCLIYSAVYILEPLWYWPPKAKAA